jgi:hypothetical protein
MSHPNADPANAALARLEASAVHARAELAKFYNEAALAAVAAALTLSPEDAPGPAKESHDSAGHIPAMLSRDELAA